MVDTPKQKHIKNPNRPSRHHGHPKAKGTICVRLKNGKVEALNRLVAAKLVAESKGEYVARKVWKAESRDALSSVQRENVAQAAMEAPKKKKAPKRKS